MKMNKYILLILSAIILNSCLIVKKTDNSDERIVSYNLSPKPDMEMSEELIRSGKGDMIAFLPKDWFLIDVEKQASNDIIAVGSNQDYTISAVFSNIRINEIDKGILNKEGLLGLARISFDKHSRKAGGSLKQIGRYSYIKMGPLNYVQYEYTNGTSVPPAKVAVFLSNQNEAYEFALVPLSFRNRAFPMQSDIDMIFRSILATIQY